MPRRGSLLGALAEMQGEGDSKGWIWRIQLLRPGFANGIPRMVFSEDSVSLTAEMLDGQDNIASYMRSENQHGYSPMNYSEQDRCGWVAASALENDGAIYAELHITRNACGTDLHALLSDASERGNENVVGISMMFDMEGDYEWMEGPDGRERGYFVVERITAVHAVDVVRAGAASDGFIGALTENGEDDMNREQILALLTARGIDVPQGASDEDVLGLLSEHLGSTEDPPAEPGTEDPPGNTEDPPAEPGTEDPPGNTEDPPANTGDSAIQGQLLELRQTNSRNAFRAALAEASLPEVFATEATQEFQGVLSDGNVPDDNGIEAIIGRYQRLSAAQPAQAPLSMGRVEVGDEERDKHTNAMLGFLCGQDQDGVESFYSLRHAFASMGGGENGIVDPYDVMREANFMGALMGVHNERARAQIENAWATLRTTDFGQILGDALHRRLIMAYTAGDMMSWEKIVSAISAITDFRKHRRVRIGGYGILPEVSEAEPYQHLTSPEDEEEVLQVVKRGGIEKLTMEMIANDDVAAIRRIPTELGIAAALTLNYVIYSLYTDPPTVADGTAAFTTAHGNLFTTALSESSARTVRAAMRKQTRYGVSNARLARMNDPKYLLVPTDLGDTADDLTRWQYRTDASNPDSMQRAAFFMDMEPLIPPTWTDVNDWAMVADPMQVPTIEVGFYMNRREPEIHMADTPTNYSMLHSDEIELRLRHIYGVVLLDWRSSALSRVA